MRCSCRDTCRISTATWPFCGTHRILEHLYGRISRRTITVGHKLRCKSGRNTHAQRETLSECSINRSGTHEDAASELCSVVSYHTGRFVISATRFTRLLGAVHQGSNRLSSFSSSSITWQFRAPCGSFLCKPRMTSLDFCSIMVDRTLHVL
jgi:hypothetical protein